MRSTLIIAILATLIIIIVYQDRRIAKLEESTRDLWSVASGESRAFVIRERRK